MTLPFFKPQQFSNADDALAYAQQIYTAHTAFLRESFARYSRGQELPRVRACYPYVSLTTENVGRQDTRLAYGFVSAPGHYQSTLTRTDLFASYYRQQFDHLLHNHGSPLEIGVSNTPIPVHFAFADGVQVEGDLMPIRVEQLRAAFDLPDLALINDQIANGNNHVEGPRPLSLFTAPRVDYSLHRLRHYTALAPQHFQNFIIFTNYQFYVDQFCQLAQKLMQPLAGDDEWLARSKKYTAFIEPGGYITPNANLKADAKPAGERAARMPQMPAYSLISDDHSGITIVNIGVGPSNAKTITDHLAVMRPHAWIMLGHCAGLRDVQKIGDYVLAHAYVRDDHVLDNELPLWVPVPALAEVQRALEASVSAVTNQRGIDLKTVMRTGTVVTTDNRNWELLGYQLLSERFAQSRAIALDMESSVIAANGFRFRVPYGTLLCVSDKPLHGELKLPGMANQFYKQQVAQHLDIGLRAMDQLRQQSLETLHSRKLRGFNEPAFQ